MILFVFVGIGLYFHTEMAEAASCDRSYAFGTRGCDNGSYRYYDYGFGSYVNENRYRNSFQDYGEGYGFRDYGYRGSGYAFDSGYRYNSYYFGSRYAFY